MDILITYIKIKMIMVYVLFVFYDTNHIEVLFVLLLGTNIPNCMQLFKFISQINHVMDYKWKINTYCKCYRAKLLEICKWHLVFALNFITAYPWRMFI